MPSMNQILNKEIPEDTHVLDFWKPFSSNVSRNYRYINHNFIFKVFSNILYYFIAAPILFVLTKIIFDVKYESRENLKNIQTGKITVCNHVNTLDCCLMGLANLPEKLYFTSLESNFQIPVVRHLIKLLNTIPIPTKPSCKKDFIEAVDTLLQNGSTIHFYPEGSLWPYYKKIRNFKTGAFDFAVQNNVPIVPCIICYRKPTGIRKLFKKKDCITVKILEPELPNTSLNKKESVIELKNRVHKKMEKVSEE